MQNYDFDVDDIILLEKQNDKTKNIANLLEWAAEKYRTKIVSVWSRGQFRRAQREKETQKNTYRSAMYVHNQLVFA